MGNIGINDNVISIKVSQAMTIKDLREFLAFKIPQYKGKAENVSLTTNDTVTLHNPNSIGYYLNSIQYINTLEIQHKFDTIASSSGIN